MSGVHSWQWHSQKPLGKNQGTNKINKADVTVGVTFGSPRQDDDTNKLFFEELRMLSSQLPLSLWGTSDCRKSTRRITQVVQSRPEDALKNPHDNIMAQFLKE